MNAVLEDIRQAVENCNRCGFCQAGCPIYKATGIEWTTARGRVSLVRDVMEQRVALDGDLREPLFNCLTCNGCVDHCPPGVQTAAIVLRAREEYLRRAGQSWGQGMVFHHLLPDTSRLAAAARLLRMGQRMGLVALARAMGVTRLMGDLGRAERLVPQLPSETGTQVVARLQRPLTRPKYKVAYFIGCAANVVYPEVAAATVRVLHRHQVEVVMPPFACCGKPAIAYGDTEAARRLVRKNVDDLGQQGVDAIVTPCATCSSFLKEYPKLLAEDGQYAEPAARFGGLAKDLSEFIASIGLAEAMGPVKARVAYHDPCHLGRFQKITAAPRALLRHIPGVELVELQEANVCCGAAGSYGLGHYDLSMKVLGRKMDNVARADAQILATSCPACTMQLSFGLRQRGLPTQMQEVVQLLDRAYQAAL